MQLSIRKLAAILIALLITVTIVTTGAGLYVLQADYRLLEDRYDTEAQDAVHNASIAIRNQVQFYQGVLEQIAGNPDVGNLLEFGETDEMANWSRELRRLLPGTLGTALASADGKVHGDAQSLRVGPACQVDLQRYASDGVVDYPLLHDDVAGLEHFDLLTRVHAPDGDQSGAVFVSFRLGILRELLDNMRLEGDQFVLRDKAGDARLTTGQPDRRPGVREYRTHVPNTSWELVLRRPVQIGRDSLANLIGADALILAVCGLLVVVLIRGTLAGFKADMARVHDALADVLAGHYEPSDAPTAIKETSILLPDIEQLALRLQTQRNELRYQSLSDPLTGVFNRRYFDLMLAHLHEQSRRTQAAILVIIDLNDFKRINDEFGHTAGDRVLQNTARYLKTRVRATDIVTRLGGDEFALILTNMARDILDDWIRALIHDFDHQALERHDERAVFCQLSIGIASIDATHYAQPEDAFDAADRAMYSVKQRRNISHSRYAIAEPGNAVPLIAAAEAK